MYEKQVKQGHYIIREADAGQHLYVAAGEYQTDVSVPLINSLPKTTGKIA